MEPGEINLNPFGEVPPDHRSGMVSLVGRANVGKSSLVNHILGEKLSIVSHVAQTTRNVIRGIHTEEGRGQIVFLDTPGVHQAKGSLGKQMNKMARRATEGIDLALLVFDASSSPRLEDDGWIRRMIKRDIPCVIVLNKIDCGNDCTAEYEELWNTIAAEKESDRTVDWLRTSANTGAGIDKLKAYIFDHLPMGPLLFPTDMLSDFPRMLAIGDVIREKYFRVLEDELPHAIGVWIQELEELENGGFRVHGRVYVERQSQKGIVIGNKGRLLRKVKQEAIADLEAIFECEVRIDLFVKVEKKWQENFFILRQLGYM